MDNLILILPLIAVPVTVCVLLLVHYKHKKKKAQNSELDVEQYTQLLNETTKNKAELMSAWEKIKDLDKTVIEISNTTIKTKMTGIRNTIGKIFYSIAKNEKRLTYSQEFFDYFIPQLTDFMSKYVEIQLTSDKTTLPDSSVLEFLDDIEIAMNKLYKNLQNDDLVDLSMDMNTLKQSLKLQGLINNLDDQN